MTDRIHVVRRPTCDYLRVAGTVSPESKGFVQDPRYPPTMHRWWRPGWSGHLKPLRFGVFTFVAWASKGSHVWPTPWFDDMHITRVDVCCDIVIKAGNHEVIGFKQDHRHLFTYRGSGNDVFKKHEVATLYVNSRESPVTLRIYKKTEKCDKADKAVWTANGWRGEDVWRIEYEYHNRPRRPVLPDGFRVPEGIDELWADGLARIRMCAVPPRSCPQQNKAPTHPWWLALGKPRRLTRRRSSEMTITPATARARAMASLERLADKADEDVLGLFLTYAKRRLRMITPGATPESDHGQEVKG